MDRCCFAPTLRENLGLARSFRPAPFDPLTRLATHPAARLAVQFVLAAVVVAAFLAVSAVALLAVLTAWTV
jgi:hypothetical protein